MNRSVIDRLNELYHRSQSQPLTATESAERDQLRREYLAMIRNQVQSSLEQYRPATGAACPGDHGDGECDCGHCH